MIDVLEQYNVHIFVLVVFKPNINSNKVLLLYIVRRYMM